MSLFARLKKAREEKKGFTLVELIVVLVILAILAAILVPALLGWIDEAKKKNYELEARSIYMAAQAVADEQYAANATTMDFSDLTRVKELVTDVTVYTISGVDDTGFKITKMTTQFKSSDGKYVEMKLDDTTKKWEMVGKASSDAPTWATP